MSIAKYEKSVFVMCWAPVHAVPSTPTVQSDFGLAHMPGMRTFWNTQFGAESMFVLAGDRKNRDYNIVADYFCARNFQHTIPS